MRRNFRKSLPLKFTQVILGAFRLEGEKWFENLPRIVAEIEANWSVEIKQPYRNLSYHYVAPCDCRDGGEAVVKIGFPGEEKNIRRELETLKFTDGRGLVKLLNFDEERFAFLLEKLTPGENLKTLCGEDDEKAVRIGIETMLKFWREPPAMHDFPTLDVWFNGLNQAEEIGFAPAEVAKARRYFAELNSNAKPQMLLHGDFHHENILSSEREPFLAIDPKGIVGDIGYDTTVFLINHANWLKDNRNLTEKLNRAICLFSEAFNIKPGDLRKWVYAQSVLSAWWTFEENSDDWKNELEYAKIWQA